MTADKFSWASDLITRSEVLALGLDDRFIARQLKKREWARVRNGAYVPAEIWAHADQLARHLMRIEAVHRTFGPKVAFSHISAVQIHGIDSWAVPLDRVHVTRLDGGASRVEPDLVHHRSNLPDEALQTSWGYLVTDPLRSVLDSASLLSTEQGLVIPDSALAKGLFTQEELATAHGARPAVPGLRNAHIVTRLADGRSGSPGETRVRYCCYRFGLPRPEIQYAVHDHNGNLLGVVDFAWPRHNLIVEFDGKIKYGALLKPGQSPTDVVFAEKRREDRIREATGWTVLRVTWDDLNDPAGLARRLASHMNRVA